MEDLIYKFLNWEIFVRAWPGLLSGLITTLKLAFLAEALSLALGLLCALIRVSKVRFIRLPVVLYVDVFRAVAFVQGRIKSGGR